MKIRNNTKENQFVEIKNDTNNEINRELIMIIIVSATGLLLIKAINLFKVIIIIIILITKQKVF